MPHRFRLSELSRWFELGPAEATRLLPMEGLRGLAVILVFFVHYGSQLTLALRVPLPEFGSAIEHLGHAGVDLFFALSGYLIYGALIRKPRPFGGFMARRVQRLYPVFLVVLALHVMLAVMSSSGGGLPVGTWDKLVTILANLLLLPGIFTLQPIVVVAWSLSYEMFFYLAVPLLIGVLRLRHWRVRWRVAAILAAVLVMQVLDWRHGRMGMFACGMLLVELLPMLRQWAQQQRMSRTIWLDVAAVAAMAVCGAVLPFGPHRVTAFCVLFVTCFLLCAAAFAGTGPLARLLVARPLRWLGNMSYSYYLLHGFMLNIVFHVLRSQAPLFQELGGATWWLLLLPAFVATVAGSVPLFLFVERPFSILPAERVRTPALPPSLPPTGVAAAG